MQVSGISAINMKAQQKSSLTNAPNMGYIAAAGMGLAALTSMSKNKTIHKSHKYFAIISLAAMVAHIFLVSFGHKQK